MKLLRIICFEFGVDPDDLFKSKYNNNTHLALKVATYVLYDRIVPNKVRLMLGLKDTAVVYRYTYWVRDQITLDADLKQKVERIKQVLNESKI